MIRAGAASEPNETVTRCLGPRLERWPVVAPAPSTGGRSWGHPLDRELTGHAPGNSRTSTSGDSTRASPSVASSPRAHDAVAAAPNTFAASSAGRAESVKARYETVAP